ncbi:MAG: hypothetical protein WCR49_02295 [Opitutae bacterium]
MSLINDALKKAQKQRTGDSPPLASMPSIGGDPASRIAKRSAPVGFNSLMKRGGLMAGALVVILVGGYFGMQRLNRPVVPPPAEPAVVAAPEISPKPATPAESIPVSRPPAPAITFNLAIPAETPPPVSSTPTVPVVAPSPVPESKPAAAVAAATSKPAPAVTTPAPAPAPAAPPVKLEPRAITFIENLRIAGIRASATDSKVLMNDRVFRSGDIVEHEIGLKLIGITANSLTFEDERGGRYTRNF